jgi:hypothetical protein
VSVPDLERLELVEQDSTDVAKIAPALEGHVSRAGDPVPGGRQELYGKVECVAPFDECARRRWKNKEEAFPDETASYLVCCQLETKFEINRYDDQQVSSRWQLPDADDS